MVLIIKEGQKNYLLVNITGTDLRFVNNGKVLLQFSKLLNEIY